MNKWIMSTPKTEERPPAPTILFGVPEGRGQSPGGQSPAVLAQMRKLSSPQEGPALTGVSHGVDSALPELGFPPRSQAGLWEAEAEEGRERLHPARVRQEGPSGKEGTPPPPPRPHLGSAGGQGGRPAPGSSESGPPPRAAPWGRQMGRPPAQRCRQETRPGLPGTRPAGRAGRGGARFGHAPRRGGATQKPAG